MNKIKALVDEAWEEALQHYKCSKVLEPLMEAAKLLKEKGNSKIFNMLEGNFPSFPFYGPILFEFNKILEHPLPNNKEVPVMCHGLPSCLEDFPTRINTNGEKIYLHQIIRHEMNVDEALLLVNESYNFVKFKMGE